MINNYRKYYYEVDKDWHENRVGVYHVSSIGNSHKELDPHEHSGPCLRETFKGYIDPVENDDKKEGNFHIGRILHKIIQEIYKHNVPNSSIEFPIIIQLASDIQIKGSIDIIDFDKTAVIDIKTSSMFTHPSSEYDYNPTHTSQISIYSGLLMGYVFKLKYFTPKLIQMVYTKKHNLETAELDIDVDKEDIKNALHEFIERVIYLDNCLTKFRTPVAEPHKWCKFCRHLDFCKEEGDIIETKKKGRYILNV